MQSVLSSFLLVLHSFFCCLACACIVAPSPLFNSSSSLLHVLFIANSHYGACVRLCLRCLSSQNHENSGEFFENFSEIVWLFLRAKTDEGTKKQTRGETPPYRWLRATQSVPRPQTASQSPAAREDEIENSEREEREEREWERRRRRSEPGSHPEAARAHCCLKDEGAKVRGRQERPNKYEVPAFAPDRQSKHTYAATLRFRRCCGK
jgi:hypothetical protein